MMRHILEDSFDRALVAYWRRARRRESLWIAFIAGVAGLLVAAAVAFGSTCEIRQASAFGTSYTLCVYTSDAGVVTYLPLRDCINHSGLCATACELREISSGGVVYKLCYCGGVRVSLNRCL